MKIVKLVAENVKRLHAVEITPEGTLITIGGKNGAGKSSVLDSIAYALGGEKLVPSEPIRVGESEGKVVVDLGDFIVTRKFKREPIPRDADKGAFGDNIIGWTETRSTLTVTNRDGARYPSPQAVLDKLLGKLTFDPLAFAELGKTADGRKQQAEILRRLVGLDLEPIDKRRQEAAAQRAVLKRSYATKLAQLALLPHHEGVPEKEVPLAEVTTEMTRVEMLRKVVAKAEQAVIEAVNKVKDNDREAATVLTMIEELELRLAAQRHALKELNANEDLLKQEVIDRETAVKDLRAEIPDVELLKQRFTDITTTNQKVHDNQRYLAQKALVESDLDQIEMFDNEIVAAEGQKRLMLEKAEFPVPGLGLNDDGVIFNALPFNQAGTAEQVRVSVAIGVALNPKIKVLLIRNGNMLDKASLTAVAAQAEKAGMQVWMEYVSEDGAGMAVMLEDGEQI